MPRFTSFFVPPPHPPPLSYAPPLLWGNVQKSPIISTMPTSLNAVEKIGKTRVNRIPLHRSSSSSSFSSSPWCYVADINPTLHDLIMEEEEEEEDTFTNHVNDVNNDENIPTMTNFLATQVWPSSRFASLQIQKHATDYFVKNTKSLSSSWTVCELGCGPGLPSLTAASLFSNNAHNKNNNNKKVIATDVDLYALELVSNAASVQNLQPILTTQVFDLVNITENNVLPEANLYVISDVFENEHVAKGAAYHTVQLLLGNDEKEDASSSVWVFAQPDRAHRRIYVKEILRLLGQEEEKEEEFLVWTDSWEEQQEVIRERMKKVGIASVPFDYSRLWLCNVDETAVQYN